MKSAFIAVILLAQTLRTFAATEQVTPTELYYRWSFSAAGNSGSITISLKDGTLTRGTENKIETTAPSIEQWRKFKEALNELGVWNWKTRYGSDETGAGASSSWQLVLKYPKRSLTSRGSLGAPKQFQQFVKALDGLFAK